MQDLGMKCIVEKFIPWLLLPEQKEHCAAVANDLIQIATNEPDFLKKVITLRGLRCHCPMYNVSCILYLLQEICLFFIFHGWTDLICATLIMNNSI